MNVARSMEPILCSLATPDANAGLPEQLSNRSPKIGHRKALGVHSLPTLSVYTFFEFLNRSRYTQRHHFGV